MRVFAEQGFGAARVEDIAARAGVSKGALYIYYADKRDLFRAAVSQGLGLGLQRLAQVPVIGEAGLLTWGRTVSVQLSRVLEDCGYRAVVRIVAGHGAAFPDLARLWTEELEARAVAPLARAIEAAQRAGEIRAGDARGFALSLIAPLGVGPICGDFSTVSEGRGRLALIEQHVDTLLRGMASARATGEVALAAR